MKIFTKMYKKFNNRRKFGKNFEKYFDAILGIASEKKILWKLRELWGNFKQSLFKFRAIIS